MSKRVLILHAYAAGNSGDDLLVARTLEIISHELGAVELTVVAVHPDSFDYDDVRFLSAVPTRFRQARDTWRVLAHMNNFDLIVGVGGGYMRGRGFLSLAKTAVAHFGQLWFSSRSPIPVVYLPQSVGPFPDWLWPWVRSRLGRVDRVFLRDDRSVTELGGTNTLRVPDLAVAGAVTGRDAVRPVDPVPVLSIRSVNGRVPEMVFDVGSQLGTYDSYIQSSTNGNDDTGVTGLLNPRKILSQQDLLGHPSSNRVVVAVRLHAALMAIASGHYVVHLAYERKGFGAFQDLGLQRWLLPYDGASAREVLKLIRELQDDESVRNEYESCIDEAAGFARWGLQEVRREVREAVTNDDM